MVFRRKKQCVARCRRCFASAYPTWLFSEREVPSALQAHREDYFNFLLQSTALFLRKNPTSPTSKPSRMRAYPTASMMRNVVDERAPKRKLTGVPATWGIVVVIIPKPSSRISIPKSIVLIDPIIPPLMGHHRVATRWRRWPANGVVVSSPMTGWNLTQPTIEASKTEKSIALSLPQLGSSLIQSLPFQRSMTGNQKPGFASGSVPISCFQRWETHSHDPL